MLDRLIRGRSREVRFSNAGLQRARGRRLGSLATGILLNLGSQVGCSGLRTGSSLPSILLAELLARVQLLVEELGRFGNLGIDQLLVVDVNQGCGEGSHSRYQS